ncbi:MAG TPA: PQQ-binding-like beta-propeller repeat protein [Streptosporangiaceae bacterium]|nr:PQQ-binding-like beta-propeller repeat protein [Streptosporangiaceae bacterium]
MAGVLTVVGSVVPGMTAVARANDVTASQNLLRDGWDSAEPNLSPAAVKTFSSAPRWNAAVDGSVYAQPLVLGSIVIVATESDWVYGLNAGTGARLWATRLGSAYPIASDRTFIQAKCTDLVPNIGVLHINPGSDLLLPVTFKPTKTGTFTGQCLVQRRDVNGAHSLMVTLTGTAIRRGERERAEPDAI